MTRLALVSVLVALVARPVNGQVSAAEAFPLAVGNVWEFWDLGPDVMQRWEVVGEATVEGETVALLEINGSRTCAVRTVVEEDGVAFRLAEPADLNAPCDVGGAFPGEALFQNGFEVTGPPTPGSVDVGGTVVTGGTWLWECYECAGYTSEGATVLEGVGPVGFWQVVDLDGMPPRVTFSYTLWYARIDGVEIGRSPIPTGPTARQAFFPHAVGDEWQYETLLTDGPTAEISTGFLVWTVTATGDPAARPTEFTFDVLRRPTTGPEARWSCTVSELAFHDWTEYRVTAGPLDCGELFPSVGNRTLTMRTLIGGGEVPVGGQTYPLQRLTGDGMVVEGGSVRATWRADAAEGLGIYFWERDVDYMRRVRGRLAYARVGGVEYGSMVVADEPQAPTAAPLSVSVGPNPAQGAATVRFALAEPAAVRVEVVDALGRRVHAVDLGPQPAGPGTVALAANGWAPGVYSIRLSAGATAATVRLVVNR